MTSTPVGQDAWLRPPATTCDDNQYRSHPKRLAPRKGQKGRRGKGKGPANPTNPKRLAPRKQAEARSRKRRHAGAGPYRTPPADTYVQMKSTPS